MSKKKIKRIVIGGSAALLVAWGALMLIIFGNRDGKDDKTRKYKDGAVTVSPTPGSEEYVVWLMTEEKWFSDVDVEMARVRYEYNENGELVRMISCNPQTGEEKTERTYRYDRETGFLSEINTNKYDFDYKETEIQYDGYGNIRRQIFGGTKSDGSWGKESEWVSNSSGDFVEIYAYNDDGNLITATVYEYDDYGNIVEMRNYSDGVWTKVMTGHLDEKGRVDKEFSIMAGSSEMTAEIIYNADGSRTKKQYIGATGEMTYMEEFDSSGRCILKQQYSDGKPTGYRRVCNYVEDETGTKGTVTVSMVGDDREEIEFTGTLILDDFGRPVFIVGTYYGIDVESNEKVESEVVRYEAEFNEFRLIAKETFNEKTIQYLYDKHGNCIAAEYSFDGGGYRREYTYTEVTLTAEQVEGICSFYEPNAVTYQGDEALAQFNCW